MKLFLILCACISTIPLSTEAMHSTQGHYRSHTANRLERIKNAKQEAYSKLQNWCRENLVPSSQQELNIIDDALDIIAKAIGKQKPYSKADLLSQGEIDTKISNIITNSLNMFILAHCDFNGIEAMLKYCPERFHQEQIKKFLCASVYAEGCKIDNINKANAKPKSQDSEVSNKDDVNMPKQYSEMCAKIITAQGNKNRPMPYWLYEDCVDRATFQNNIEKNIYMCNILYTNIECKYLIPVTWRLSWREQYRMLPMTVIPGVLSCIKKQDNKLILYRKDAIIISYNTEGRFINEDATISLKEMPPISMIRYDGAKALSVGIKYRIFKDNISIEDNTIVLSDEESSASICSNADHIIYISNPKIFDILKQYIESEKLQPMEACIVPLQATPLEKLEDNIEDKEAEFVNLYNSFIETKHLLINYSELSSEQILENIYTTSSNGDKNIEVLQGKFKELKKAIAAKLTYHAAQEDLGNDVNIEEYGQKKEKSKKEKKQYIHQHKGNVKKHQSLNPKIRQQQIYEQAEEEAKEMLKVRLTTKERNRQSKKLLSEEEQKFFNKPLKVKEIRNIFNELNKTHSMSGNAQTGSSHQRVTVDGEHHTIVRPHNSNSEADSRTRSTVMSLSSMVQQ